MQFQGVLTEELEYYVGESKAEVLGARASDQ